MREREEEEPLEGVERLEREVVVQGIVGERGRGEAARGRK
jgi:hypothetical protein